MNLLEIVILAALILLICSGLRQGLVRKLASVLSLVLTMALVAWLLPFMTDFLKDSTPVYEYIVERCQSVVSEQLTASLSGGVSAADAYRSMGREQIKALMEQYGYDSSVVDALSDGQFEEYREQLIREYFGQESAQGTAELPDSLSLTEEQQETVISSLPLPEPLKKLILSNNNQEGYRRLQASTFQDYIINCISSAILNVVAFLLAVIVVQTVVWIFLRLLRILSRVPVISLVNRLAGGALGAFQWLFLTWLFFLVLSMCQATEAGQYLLQMVWDSDYLNLLYDSDLFIQIVLRAAAIFS